MKIYVDVEYSYGKTFLFVQSNYVSDGMEYATKILYDVEKSGLDIETYLINIIPTDYVSEELSQAVRNSIKLYVSNRIYKNPRTRNVDLSDARNVYIISENNNVISNGYENVKVQLALLERGNALTVDGFFGKTSKSKIW